ncbi:MAG: gephyrin-like molybdotransferase Glp, partial [Gammaproteobacteria bacterium]
MTDNNATAPDCCAENISGLLQVAEARRQIAAQLAPVRGEEQVHVRSALGRVLAAPIISAIDVPPYTNSAMDGYAVRGADLPAQSSTELTVIGTAFAGEPFAGTVGKGECVRIMTGGKMPQGADTVIMQEQVEREGDRIAIQGGHQTGQNVRLAGEDMAAGEAVLEPGKRLMPAELGLIASLGIGEVRVSRRLRVAFFSTGDELRSIGEPLGDGQIYDSNRYTLHGMLTRLGVEVLDMGVIRDERDAVRNAFLEASRSADVVITSGGVSVGEADYVKETLDALGSVGFWKIAMKPGKPLAFGRVNDALFFGLPGNPVSVMVTFYQFVEPALRQMMGEHNTDPVTVRVPCAGTLRKVPGRTEFQRGCLERDRDGRLVVNTTGLQGSHVLSSMSRANCFIILPGECAG